MRIKQQLLRQVIKAVGRHASDPEVMLKGLDCLGYVPNLGRPRTVNEKILARKAGPIDPLWPVVSDKVRVRKFVADRIGPQYLAKSLLITENPDAIELDDLPQQFVVKANHGSGWTRIVRDKSSVTEADIRACCREWLATKYGAAEPEPWYDAIPPRILVEERLCDHVHGIPLDYKFWVFHARAHCVQVDYDRFGTHSRSFYDRNWQRHEWRLMFPPAPEMPRPPLLTEMIEVAERLGDGFDFVRVDLYSVDDASVTFGEMTLAPGGGWERFYPGEVDRDLGDLW